MVCCCEFFGKDVMMGNNVFYVNNKFCCWFLLNLCNVFLLSDILGEFFKLKVSVYVFWFVEYCGGFDVYFLKVFDD